MDDEARVKVSKTIRIDENLEAALLQAARANLRSLSGEAAIRLHRSFEQPNGEATAK